jgi:alpha-D-ribose 1-methylphosphonate 5-phosphate C-P lyase
MDFTTSKACTLYSTAQYTMYIYIVQLHAAFTHPEIRMMLALYCAGFVRQKRLKKMPPFT